MKRYYVNKSSYGNPNNDHEVHHEDCYWLPSEANRVYLGFFSNGCDAVIAARKYYSNVDGCAHCCPECNKD